MKKEDHDIRHQRLPHEAHALLPRRPSHDEFVHNVVRLIIASMPVRSIGMVRAKAANALTNLVYNIFRYVQINIYQPQLITCKG